MVGGYGQQQVGLLAGIELIHKLLGILARQQSEAFDALGIRERRPGFEQLVGG
jgi:hypothetical protein